MSHRLFFSYNRPANVDNHYVVGAGVGSKSRFVRSALRRRSSNNAQGKPCCSVMPKTMDNISSKTDEKNKCTYGMVWNDCGSACTATCDDPTPLCTKQCVAKCECPMGQYLEGGICITSDKCPMREDMLTGAESSTSGCPPDWTQIREASFCCLTTMMDPSGCTDINAACYLHGTDFKTLCPDSSMVNCDDVKYKCDTTAGKCLPSLQGTTSLEDCSCEHNSFKCDTSTAKNVDGSAPAFVDGNLADVVFWKQNFPKPENLSKCTATETITQCISARGQTPAFKTGYAWLSDTNPSTGLAYTKSSLSSIELAKVWILATHGLSKTWDSGDTVHGGWPTCSRALSTAGMESGAHIPPINEWDGHFYQGSGCAIGSRGGCWQASNHQPDICTDYTNPFCAALQAWGHNAGASLTPSSCDTKTPGSKATSCTVDQLRTYTGGLTGDGNNQGCHFGALCYGWNATGWNSPLYGALFRQCTENYANIGKPYTQVPACNQPSKAGEEPKYNCQIAECACQIALQELQADPEYQSITFNTDILSDQGYTMFKDACSQGPIVR